MAILITIFQYVGSCLFAVVRVRYYFLRVEYSRSMLIKAQTGKVGARDNRCVPYANLSIVLVATMSIEINIVRAIRNFARPMLYFPEFSAVVVRMGRILSELISVYVVSRVRGLRLAGLVGHGAVMTIVGSEE